MGKGAHSSSSEFLGQLAICAEATDNGLAVGGGSSWPRCRSPVNWQGLYSVDITIWVYTADIQE